MNFLNQQIMDDIRENPDHHVHAVFELFECCTVDGVLDMSLLEAHSRYVNLGSNGGIKCDVIDGCCSCGAVHNRVEKLAEIEALRLSDRISTVEFF